MTKAKKPSPNSSSLAPHTVAGDALLLTPADQRLSPDALCYARDAMSPATRRAYAAQWKLWCKHCAATGIAPLPATPDSVANWLAQRAAHGTAHGRRAQAGRSGQSLSTLRQATSAIRLAHLAAGHAFDPRAPAIYLVLKGVARARAELPLQASPLRGATVASLIATVAVGKATVAGREGDSLTAHGGDCLRLREARDAATFALGYCFALRRSELAGLDFERLGSGTGALVITPDHLEVCLARSKRSDGQPSSLVVPTTHNRLAVDAIRAWLSLAGIAPGEPVLRRIFKSGRVGPQRLDPQSIPIIIKQRLTQTLMAKGMTEGEARAAAAGYSGHSLRVGFAVTAAEAGSDAGAIQRALGHKTPHMAARYSRAAHLSRTSPHRLPGVGIEQPRKSRKQFRGRSP